MSENTSDLLKGIIIGGLVGAVLGILFSPKSGKETREDIVGASEDAIRRIKELGSSVIRKAENAENRESDSAEPCRASING
jgi:gas vesicle protein